MNPVARNLAAIAILGCLVTLSSACIQSARAEINLNRLFSSKSTSDAAAANYQYAPNDVQSQPSDGRDHGSPRTEVDTRGSRTSSSQTSRNDKAGSDSIADADLA